MQQQKKPSRWLHNVSTFLENNMAFSCLKKSFTLMIPIILVSSFSTVIISMPIPAFQQFLESWQNGILKTMLGWIDIATTQTFSAYLIFMVAQVYSRRTNPEFAPAITANAFVCYIITTVGDIKEVGISIFAPENMATAFISTLICCSLFNFIVKRLSKLFGKSKMLGLEFDFQTAITAVIPILICIFISIIFKFAFIQITGYQTINLLLVDIIVMLFNKIGYGALGSFAYVFLNGFLYMFGIHAGYVLTPMIYTYYGATMANSTALAAGTSLNALPHIVNSSLLNSFVFIGGAGATLCLMIALCFYIKNNFNRKLFALGLIPSLFNITEVALLGFPIIFNPIMLIPFVLTPVALLIISAGATYFGLVPICTNITYWSTPLFFSGYLATNSWRGVVLQLICVLVGAAIYAPFVKIAMVIRTNIAKQNINQLTELLKEKEQNGSGLSLKSCDKHIVSVAQSLSNDLQIALKSNNLELHYQPQMTLDNHLYGVEALLRWNHPTAGYIYPPLIVELATEENLLDELGLRIISLSCKTLDRLSKNSEKSLHLSVNISPTQLEKEDFYLRVKEIVEKYSFENGALCFEITEQVALVNTSVVSDQIGKLRDLGIAFHMDDFGMGHSSMLYLQSNEFEAVKLDGSLTKQMINNQRSQNIISGINDMSKSLNYDLIAEYVETDEQRNALAQMGCNIYQGYLYSPALPLPLLEDYLTKNEIYTPSSENIDSDNLYI